MFLYKGMLSTLRDPQKTHKLIPLLYIIDTYVSIPYPFLGQEMTYLAIPWQS